MSRSNLPGGNAGGDEAVYPERSAENKPHVEGPRYETADGRTVLMKERRAATPDGPRSIVVDVMTGDEYAVVMTSLKPIDETGNLDGSE